jgi:hypothetical protein
VVWGFWNGDCFCVFERIVLAFLLNLSPEKKGVLGPSFFYDGAQFFSTKKRQFFLPHGKAFPAVRFPRRHAVATQVPTFFGF